METPEKIVWFSLKLTKRLKLYKFGLISDILHQEHLKMRVKKENIFQDIALKNFNSIESIFFRFTKISFFAHALT